MRGVLFWRECRRLRTSAAPWLVAVATAFASGVIFLVNLNKSWEWDLTGLVTFLSYLLLFTAPALAMGMIAGEREGGTWTVARSDPVSPRDLVLSKFAALYATYALIVATTAVPALLFIAERGGDFDPGRQGAAIAAHLLMSALYLAISLAASAHARTPLVAFFMAFTFLLALILTGGVGSAILGPWGRRLAIDPHLNGFALGLMPWKDLAYFGTGIAIFLGLAIRGVAIEGRPGRRAVTSLGWIAIWALAQGHLERIPGALDASLGQVSRPTAEALGRLRSLEDPITLTTIWSATERHAPLVTGYVDALAREVPHVQVRHLDLESDDAAILGLLRDHRVDPRVLGTSASEGPAGGILVQLGDRAELVPAREMIQLTQSPGKTKFRRWRVEFALVRRLGTLSHRRTEEIALISAAGSEVEGTDEVSLSFDRLRAEGYSIVEVLPEALDADRHPVAFLCNPRSSWNHAREALAAYREAGGTLVVCLEPGGVDEAGPLSPTARTLQGFDDRYPDRVPGWLPSDFTESYGDLPVLLERPLVFTASGAEVFLRANEKPVAVRGHHLVKIGDVDWLRRVYQQHGQLVNGLALVYLVQTIVGDDAQYKVRQRTLDATIARLDEERLDAIERWMLMILPGGIALLGLAHAAKRQWL